MAGNDGGEHVRGGRSSGEVELVASRHGEGRAGVLRAPASAWKTKACSVASQRGYGHDGDVRWRRRASASMAEVVRGRGRARGEGETVAELTAVAGERTASSGKGWSERGSKEDLWWPELRTSSVQRLRGERALGARPT